MALIFLEGFEQYPLGAAPIEMGDAGWIPTSSFTSNLTIVAGTRHGSYGHAFVGNFGSINVYRPVAPVTEFTCGFAWKANQTINGDQILAFTDGGPTNQVNVATTAGGELRVRRSSTDLEVTSGLGLSAGTWYYIECKFKIDNAVGTYEIHVDGKQVLVGTSQDTQATANNTIDGVFLQSSTNQDNTFDDIYFLDTSGSDNTSFLGDCRVETVFPDSDGNEVDFTPSAGANWENVDDGLVPDFDSTYNHGATAGDRDLYGFAALTGDVNIIFGVYAMMYVRKEEAGFREVRVITRSNTTEVPGPTVTLGTDYVFKQHMLENNPDGGGNWDEASVNAAQFGIEIVT